jgi:DNA-binding NarL/FixJ family response regulator
MPFIELGNDMRLLVNAALKNGAGIPRLWLEDIRSRASAYGKNLAGIVEQYQSLKKAETVLLNRNEISVLKYHYHGSKREEIAASMGLSLSVVKSAITRIYSKLGAVNRTDAIRIASGMKLL